MTARILQPDVVVNAADTSYRSIDNMDMVRQFIYNLQPRINAVCYLRFELVSKILFERSLWSNELNICAIPGKVKVGQRRSGWNGPDTHCTTFFSSFNRR